MNYEERYHELREAVDRTLDAYLANGNDRNRIAHVQAMDEFEAFCTDILCRLMDENSDILKNLKEI